MKSLKLLEFFTGLTLTAGLVAATLWASVTFLAQL